MARKNRKTKVVDVKKAAARDVETPEVKLPAKKRSEKSDWETRVRKYEEQGMTRSDAQAVVDAEDSHKLPAKNASAVAKGAAYHVLAGRPSKPAVVACFGKTGYSLSWVSRAQKLGIQPEELCERFRTDAEAVKQSWAALSAK